MDELGLIHAFAVNMDADVVCWLTSVFAENGSLPGPDLGRILFDRRLAVARTALARLIDAFERESGVRTEMPIQYERPSTYDLSGFVKADSTYVFGISELDILLAVAEDFHDVFQDVNRRVWPLCPDHRCGVHPERVDDRVGWRCRVGDHVLPGVLDSVNPPRLTAAHVAELEELGMLRFDLYWRYLDDSGGPDRSVRLAARDQFGELYPNYERITSFVQAGGEFGGRVAVHLAQTADTAGRIGHLAAGPFEDLWNADEEAFFGVLLPAIPADIGLRAITSMYITKEAQDRARQILTSQSRAGVGRSAELPADRSAWPPAELGSES
ncbi:MAG TPA: hypothetical protein VGX23_25770 [Actinocrinis sp.]|nr:hypothetical protein [Actinocrinis sp.]